jgi:hypothetical protein
VTEPLSPDPVKHHTLVVGREWIERTEARVAELEAALNKADERAWMMRDEYDDQARELGEARRRLREAEKLLARWAEFSEGEPYALPEATRAFLAASTRESESVEGEQT